MTVHPARHLLRAKDLVDCKGTYEDLRSRGVEFQQEPTEQPYGIDAALRRPVGQPDPHRAAAITGKPHVSGPPAPRSPGGPSPAPGAFPLARVHVMLARALHQRDPSAGTL